MTEGGYLTRISRAQHLSWTTPSADSTGGISRGEGCIHIGQETTFAQLIERASEFMDIGERGESYLIPLKLSRDRRFKKVCTTTTVDEE